jgi:hypothetical protein
MSHRSRVPSPKEWIYSVITRRSMDQLSPDIQRVLHESSLLPGQKRANRISDAIRQAATIRAELLAPLLREYVAWQMVDLIKKHPYRPDADAVALDCETRKITREVELGFWEQVTDAEREIFNEHRKSYLYERDDDGNGGDGGDGVIEPAPVASGSSSR